MRAVHPRGQVRADFDSWQMLLDGPVDRVFDALTLTIPEAVELRQNTPFAGVLTDRERSRALAAFRSSVQVA
jgi:hypothetical protein